MLCVFKKCYLSVKMSSIYWNSMEFDSEGTLSDKNSSNPRNYVDPWDLENYAYIRKRLDPQMIEPPMPGFENGPLDTSLYYTPYEREQIYADRSTAKYAGRSELEFRNERIRSDSPIYYHQPYCEEDLYGLGQDFSGKILIILCTFICNFNCMICLLNF